MLRGHPVPPHVLMLSAQLVVGSTLAPFPLLMSDGLSVGSSSPQFNGTKGLLCISICHTTILIQPLAQVRYLGQLTISVYYATLRDLLWYSFQLHLDSCLGHLLCWDIFTDALTLPSLSLLALPEGPVLFGFSPLLLGGFR